MKLPWLTVLPAFLTLAGCGYVGPILPPSAQVPLPVTDLSVVERGDRLVVQFTAATHTTDGIAIRQYRAIDLRVGEANQPFDQNAWLNHAHQIDIEPPDTDENAAEARTITVTQELPAAEWVGKRVALAVRTSARKDDHYSAWSSPQFLDVIAPLPSPEVAIEPTSAGYKLTVAHPQADIEYRIYRQGPGEKTSTQVGATTTPSYVDRTARWNTSYVYSVIAAKDKTESLAWVAKPVSSPDRFPPAVPLELTAFPSADSIQVSWQRSPDADLTGYFVYRSHAGGAWEKLNGLVNVPTFSDTKLEHGQTYRYAVTAIDQTGNESEKSAPIEILFR